MRRVREQVDWGQDSVGSGEARNERIGFDWGNQEKGKKPGLNSQTFVQPLVREAFQTFDHTSRQVNVDKVEEGDKKVLNARPT